MRRLPEMDNPFSLGGFPMPDTIAANRHASLREVKPSPNGAC
jgi:hypothetical protein